MNQLVPVTTSEEVELALASMRIAWQAEELSQLRAKLAPLEAAFATFEQRVTDRAGALMLERTRLRRMCSELEHFTTRLHARLIADPENHLSEVFSPEELRSIGNLCGIQLPEDWFEDVSRATTSGDGWFSADRTWAIPPPSPQSKSDGEELRTLYRQLARSFHPDLTDNASEHHFRQEMMLRINHAWDMRDLVAMRAIGTEVGDLLAGQTQSRHAHRLAWLRHELARLETETERIRQRIVALRSSKTVALWHNPALANAAIARHIARLQREIEALQQSKDKALQEFRLALGAYAAAR